MLGKMSVPARSMQGACLYVFNCVCVCVCVMFVCVVVGCVTTDVTATTGIGVVCEVCVDMVV